MCISLRFPSVWCLRRPLYWHYRELKSWHTTSRTACPGRGAVWSGRCCVARVIMDLSLWICWLSLQVYVPRSIISNMCWDHARTAGHGLVMASLATSLKWSNWCIWSGELILGSASISTNEWIYSDDVILSLYSNFFFMELFTILWTNIYGFGIIFFTDMSPTKLLPSCWGIVKDSCSSWRWTNSSAGWLKSTRQNGVSAGGSRACWAGTPTRHASIKVSNFLDMCATSLSTDSILDMSLMTGFPSTYSCVLARSLPLYILVPVYTFRTNLVEHSVLSYLCLDTVNLTLEIFRDSLCNFLAWSIVYHTLSPRILCIPQVECMYTKELCVKFVELTAWQTGKICRPDCVADR